MIIESFMMLPNLNAEILAAGTKLAVVFYDFNYIEQNGVAFDVQAMKSRSLLFADVHLKKSCIFLSWVSMFGTVSHNNLHQNNETFSSEMS